MIALTPALLSSLRKLQHGARPVTYRNRADAISGRAAKRLREMGMIKYADSYNVCLTTDGLLALVAAGAGG